MSDIKCKGCTEGGYHSGKCTYYPKEKAMSKFKEWWKSLSQLIIKMSPNEEIAKAAWNESRRIALEDAAKVVDSKCISHNTSGWSGSHAQITAYSGDMGEEIRKLKEDL